MFSTQLSLLKSVTQHEQAKCSESLGSTNRDAAQVQEGAQHMGHINEISFGQYTEVGLFCRLFVHAHKHQQCLSDESLPLGKNPLAQFFGSQMSSIAVARLNNVHLKGMTTASPGAIY